MKHVTMNLLNYFWKKGVKPTKNVVDSLSAVATSGDYADLKGKPTIPSGTNSLLATIPGTWMDAAQGPVIQNQIDTLKNGVNDINSKMSYTWKALTLEYGSTQAWNQMIVRKYGKVCILVGVLVVPAGVVAWEKHQIFTFPDGYKPAASVDSMATTNAGQIYRLMTNTNKADIVFQASQNSEQEIWFNVPYIAQ